MNFENIKKTIRTAAKIGATSLTLLDQGSNLSSENPPSLNEEKIDKEIIEKNNEIETTEIDPKDYDLSLMPKFNIRDLDKKISLDSAYIEESMLKSLLNDRLNKENRILSELLEKTMRKVANDIPKDLYVSLLKQKEKIKQLKEWINNKDYTKFKNELSPEEKEHFKIAPELFKIIEKARKEIIELISSKEYKKKLEIEFNCSEKNAGIIQQKRLKNVKFANYSIVGPEEMLRTNHPNSAGFFSNNSNHITFTYAGEPNSYYFKNFYDTAIHELIHLSTNAEKGMSKFSKNILSKDSFYKRSDYSEKQNKSMARPTERYARLKILERDLANLGIKKIGEEFTFKHYEAMLRLYREKELLPGGFDFLEFTKTKLDMYNHDTKKHFEFIKKLFDEIAETNKNKKDNTYKNPTWNYEDPANLA